MGNEPSKPSTLPDTNHRGPAQMSYTAQALNTNPKRPDQYRQTQGPSSPLVTSSRPSITPQPVPSHPINPPQSATHPPFHQISPKTPVKDRFSARLGFQSNYVKPQIGFKSTKHRRLGFQLIREQIYTSMQSIQGPSPISTSSYTLRPRHQISQISSTPALQQPRSDMSWADGLPPLQQRLDQWFAPRRDRKGVSTVVRSERVEEAFVVKRGLKRKVDVVSLGSEERYEVKKEVKEVVETKRGVEVISLGSEDAIEEVDGSLRVGSGELQAQVTPGLKRKVEVLSSGSEDEDEEAVRVEEMLQMSSAPNQSVGIVSLGSEEDDIGEAKVAKAVYQQRRKPTVLSRSPKSVEEGEGYDGDEEYVEGVVDEDESEDQYLYKEGGDLEVTLQDTRDPAVIRWLEGVDSEVIEISSGEPLSTFHSHFTTSS